MTVEQAEAKVKELEAKSDAQISELENKLDAFETQITDAEAVVDEAVEKVKNKAEEKVNQVKEKIDKAKEIVDQSKQKVDEIREQITNARKDVEKEAMNIKNDIEKIVIDARNEIAVNIFDIDKCEAITMDAIDELIAQVRLAIPRIKKIVDGILENIRVAVNNLADQIKAFFKEIKLFLEEIKTELECLLPGASKLKWYKDGEEVTDAMIGEELLISAEVEDIPDGESLKITIYEHDDDGKHDEVASKTVAVKDGKVEWPWEMVYVEDSDDGDSDEEGDYTQPEYFYVLESERWELKEESEILEMKDWIELELFDSDNTPLANEEFILVSDMGDEVKGILNEKGKARIDNLPNSKTWKLKFK